MQSFLNHSQGVKSDLPHLVEMLSEEYLEYLAEGGRSSEIQFNSEIGPLLAFCEKKPLDGEFSEETFEDYFNLDKIQNADSCMADVKKWLFDDQNYVPQMFKKYYDLTKDKIIPLIKKEGELPSKFGWIGKDARKQDEDANPADIDFIGTESLGVSMKAKSTGITLANLKPETIMGFKKGGAQDVLNDYTMYHGENRDVNLFLLAKKKVFIRVLNATRRLKGEFLVPIKGKRGIDKYKIRHIGNNKFEIFWDMGSNKITSKVMDKTSILDPETLKKAQKWMRVFGDWFQANKNNQDLEKLYQGMANVAAENVLSAIKSTMTSSSQILKALNMNSTRSYYYATDKYVYRVPSGVELRGELEVKDVTFKKSAGVSGVFFVAEIGLKDNDESMLCTIEIRYGQGTFAGSQDARVKDLKNAEALLWRKL